MIRGERYIVRAIETGAFSLDGGAMFGVVPKPLWERMIPADARNGIRLAMRALLLVGDERHVLVDCGLGVGHDDAWAARYDLQPRESTLLASLDAAGSSPAAITDLVVTHLHFDHAGGLATPDESGRLVPTFPNARHHVQRAHLAHALAPTPKDRASFLPQRFLPVEAAGLFVPYDGRAEVAPGVTVLPVSGHSPGMQVVRVDDGPAPLLYLADLVPTRAHLPAPWIMAYDNEPLLTLREKETIVVPFATSGGILVFEHDPVLAAGRFDWIGGKPVLLEEVDLS
jgi:glyoxylase-like metal-dependent hydrolase (beta-lactamase superfamily II)